MVSKVGGAAPEAGRAGVGSFDGNWAGTTTSPTASGRGGRGGEGELRKRQRRLKPVASQDDVAANGPGALDVSRQQPRKLPAPSASTHAQERGEREEEEEGGQDGDADQQVQLKVQQDKGATHGMRDAEVESLRAPSEGGGDVDVHDVTTTTTTTTTTSFLGGRSNALALQRDASATAIRHDADDQATDGVIQNSADSASHGASASYFGTSADEFLSVR